MHNTDLIPTAEVAAILGKEVRTVHRMVERRELTPAVKTPGLRGAYLFRREDVERLAQGSAA